MTTATSAATVGGPEPALRPGASRTARRARFLPDAAFVALVALVALLALVVTLPARADRRDQKAADLYNDGVALIKKGKFQEGAVKINKALERGATEPNEEQGSQSRFLARRYDPYYWLGVAQMEMGLSEQALGNFEKSLSIVPVGRSEPLIKGWPEEYGDLQRRMAVLLKKLEGPGDVRVAEGKPTPAPTAAPHPTAVVVAVVPTPTPLVVKIARAPTPVVPTPTPATDWAALDDFIARYEAWMKDEVAGPVASPVLGPRVARLREARRKGNLSPAALRGLLDGEVSFFKETAAPVLRTAALRAAADAFGRQDWALVDSHLARARSADPGAPQVDAMECAVRVTRWVLGGRRDAGELKAAQEALARWRQKEGASRPLPAIFSPAMRAALGVGGTGTS